MRVKRFTEILDLKFYVMIESLMEIFTAEDIYAIVPEGMDGRDTGVPYGTILLQNGYAITFQEQTPHATPMRDTRYLIKTLAPDTDGTLKPHTTYMFGDYQLSKQTIHDLVYVINEIGKLDENPEFPMNYDIRASNTMNWREERNMHLTYPLTQIGKHPIEPSNGQVYEPENLEWRPLAPA